MAARYGHVSKPARILASFLAGGGRSPMNGWAALGATIWFLRHPGGGILGKGGADIFQVFVKPAGASCNLDCRYCYYRDKSGLYPEAGPLHMTDELWRNTSGSILNLPRGRTLISPGTAESPRLWAWLSFERSYPFSASTNPPAGASEMACKPTASCWTKTGAAFWRAKDSAWVSALTVPRNCTIRTG